MSLPFLVRLSSLDSAAIAPAVRLAVALSIKETILEHHAPKEAQVTARAWDKIRPDLGYLFRFSAGKITLPPDTGFDEFDLLMLRASLKLGQKKKEAKYPTDPRILDLIDLGIEPAEATKLAKHIVRTYGESHLVKAIKVAKAKEPKPLDPHNYLLGVVKAQVNAVAAGGVRVIGLGARRVKRFVRVPNPESAKTELIGWEAPSSTENGAVRYAKGNRRLIYRLRSGHLQFVDPKPDQPIPSAEQDPGVIIED